MGDKKKKIYVKVKAINISKVFDKKYTAKIKAMMSKVAPKTLGNNNKVTVKEPKGWDKEKDKGYNLNIELVSLTKETKKNEIIFKAEVKAVPAFMKNNKLTGKNPIGLAGVKIGATQKKIDGDVLFCVETALKTMIDKKLVPYMEKAPLP